MKTMLAIDMTQVEATAAMRDAIQKVATGPEYSKDLSFEEARSAMAHVLSEAADPVQTAIFFIALRMKRETQDENKGILQAIVDIAEHVTAPVDELVDIADPYDGHCRGLPMSAFIAPVLAAYGVPAVSHGVESVGPKFGITHRKVLRAAGIDVDISTQAAAQRLANPDIGWAYVDQRAFCPELHKLTELRTRMVKRPVLTTVEVLVKPILAKKKTHLLTGYVHKAYPPIYADLARFVGYDSAMIVRGVEGGVIPSLQQPAALFYYHDKCEEQKLTLDPTDLGIEQSSRAVPLPKDLPAAKTNSDGITTAVDADAAAQATAELGMATLQGQTGPAHDSLVYASAITLYHLGREDSLANAAETVRKVLDSGKAFACFKA